MSLDISYVHVLGQLIIAHACLKDWDPTLQKTSLLARQTSRFIWKAS